MIKQSIYLVARRASGDRQSFLQAHHVFRSFGDLSLIASFIGVILGAVHVLSNLSNPDNIGPGMAVALMCLLYGCLAKLFVGKALADSFLTHVTPEPVPMRRVA